MAPDPVGLKRMYNVAPAGANLKELVLHVLLSLEIWKFVGGVTVILSVPKLTPVTVIFCDVLFEPTAVPAKFEIEVGESAIEGLETEPFNNTAALSLPAKVLAFVEVTLILSLL